MSTDKDVSAMVTRKDWLKLGAASIAVVACTWLVSHAAGAAQRDLGIGIICLLAELFVILLWASQLTAKEIARLHRELGQGLTESRDESRRLTAILREGIAGGDELSTVLRYHDRGWPPSEAPKVWFDLLCRLQQTYSATNYIDSRHLYDTEWGKAALAIQNGKKRAGPSVEIKKVFVIDDPEEVAILSAHLERQREIGVNLQYIYHHEIAADPTLARGLSTLLSVDFGIFDESHVLVWRLEDRKVGGVQVLFGRETVDRHRAFFDLLYLRAQEKHGNETLLVRLQEAQREAIAHWPPYDAPYEKLDYALRNPTGWLYTFGAQRECERYGVYVGGELIGFTLLDRAAQDPLTARRDDTAAEFYVAVHPKKVKGGLGRRATVAALQEGFGPLGLDRIFLKVRVGHPGRRLYAAIGFQHRDTKVVDIHGESVDFDIMDITASQFADLHGGSLTRRTA